MNVSFYFVCPSRIHLIQLTIDIDYQLLYNKIYFGTLPAPPWVSQQQHEKLELLQKYDHFYHLVHKNQFMYGIMEIYSSSKPELRNQGIETERTK